jgi:hypothetical protein
MGFCADRNWSTEANGALGLALRGALIWQWLGFYLVQSA